MGDAHTLTIPRAARYFTAGAATGTPREAWFCLHGYGQLAAAFLEQFTGIASEERLFVAPEGLSRFYLREGAGEVGASWMTREGRAEEIEDYVRYLDAVYACVLGSHAPGRVRVHVLGFSQGAATAFRWAALGTSRIDRLTLWGGDVPPDVDLEARREALARVELSLVSGERDAFQTPAKRTRDAERLAAAGLSCRVTGFAGGHRLDRETLARLAGD